MLCSGLVFLVFAFLKHSEKHQQQPQQQNECPEHLSTFRPKLLPQVVVHPDRPSYLVRSERPRRVELGPDFIETGPNLLEIGTTVDYFSQHHPTWANNSPDAFRNSTDIVH